MLWMYFPHHTGRIEAVGERIDITLDHVAEVAVQPIMARNRLGLGVYRWRRHAGQPPRERGRPSGKSSKAEATQQRTTGNGWT